MRRAGQIIRVVGQELVPCLMVNGGRTMDGDRLPPY
jgi:hypothetical protein